MSIMRLSVRFLLALSCVALASPGLADAQSRAETSLLLLTSRAHYQMRLAQLCKQPDEARQQQMAAAVNAWLAMEATSAGVSRERMDQEAAEARQRAESAYPGTPPDAVCQDNAQSLITFSGG